MRFIKIFTTFIYRSMIIQEFTSQPSKFIQFGSQFLNELMILKCGLLIYSNLQEERNSFESFIVYMIRPYKYFIRANLQVAYTYVIFLLMQLMIIYWCYLIHYREKRHAKSFINVIQKFEAHSTLNFLLISFWKTFFMLLTEFLGLLILEGCFELLLDDIQDNLFCIICSIIIISEIILINIFQELYWNQSLNFIPKKVNKFVQQTQLVLYSKLLKIMTLALFTSQIINKSYLVLGMSIFIALFELYIELIFKIRLDRKIIQLNAFMQCLILCNSIQQLFTAISDIQSQFLWLIVTILFFKLICLNFLSDSILQLQSFQQNKNQQLQYSIIGREKINAYQHLSKTRTPEYYLTNKILIQQHQQTCFDKKCECKDEEMIMIKLSDMIIKEQIQEYKKLIHHSKQKSSFLYLELIQLLVLNNKYFDALNITQKLIDQFNRKSNFSTQTKLIKDQISLQHKLLFKLLQQQILIAIQYSIQNRSQNSIKTQGFKQAIKSYQQKKDSEKSIQNQFNEILKQKIQFLEDLLDQHSLNPKTINNKALKIIKNIDQFKELLTINFKKIPTNSNKGLLLFFEIEILNDLISSQTINSASTLSDNQEEIIFISNIYQQLVNQFSYAKFNLCEEGNIELASNNAQNQLIIGKNHYNCFSEMIPLSLLTHHKYFIEEFITTGQNKYYLNIYLSFLQIQAGVIIPIELCMDILFDEKMNQLTAIAFFKEVTNTRQFHYLLIDNKFQIKEISKCLYYEILDYPAYLKMQLLNLSIFSLIPELKQEDFSQDRTLRSYKLCFPLSVNKQTATSFKNQNKSHHYKGDISINLRILNNQILYYVIEISDFKSERKETMEALSLCQLDIDEKEIINIPLDINLFYEQTMPQQQVWQQRINSNLASERQLQYVSIEEFDSQQKKLNQITFNQLKAGNSTISNRNQKSEISEKRQELFDDAHSQISSVAAVRRSLYYKQFQLINELIDSKIFPPNIKLFNLIYIIYIIIGIINLGVLIDQVTNLKRYQELMVLLKIKYEIYEPIESFLNTRYTIVGLNTALQIKLISQQEYDQLILFPRSNLAKGYDDLKVNIMDVIQKKEFQSFLKDKYFEAYWYTSTNYGTQRNTTFRSGILAMLNYQYEYKLAYTIRPLVIDSAYSYYSYKNYIPIFDMFTEFNQDVLNLLFTLIQDQQNQLQLLNIIFNILLALISVGSMLLLMKQRKLKNKFLSMLCQQDKDVMIYESQRLQLLSNQINSNYHHLYQYALDVQSFDDSLKIREKDFYEMVNKKRKKVSNQRRNQQLKIFNLIQLGIILANFCFVLLVNIVTIDSLDKYLYKQKNTGQIYSSLSNTGVNVLILYAQREILYRIALFSFLSKDDIQDIYDQVDSSLIQINEFAQQFIQINSDDYLLDQNSLKLFQDASSQSICNYLPEKYANVSQSLCPIVLQGVLSKGLIPTLNLMQNSIIAEKQVNNFTTRPQSQIPVKELEGATFTAWVIQQLVNDLEQNLMDYSTQLQLSYNFIYAFAIVFQLLFGLLLVIFNSKYEIQQLNDLKKVIYILPQSILLFDDSFQRQIKIIMKQEELK